MELNRRKLLLGLLACPVCASAARADGPHWSYEGEHGAEKWGEMDSRFKACAAGDQQSPVDLTHAIPAEVDSLALDWKKQAFQVVNNGHTIQANAEPGSSLKAGGETFELKQFHFHTPSEHAVDGKRTAMEVHFVHAHTSGRLAVVGVLIVPGRRNKAFAEVIGMAPRAEGEARLQKAIDPAKLMPRSREFFRYEGSLTTPPCSEVVDWNVFREPVEVAESDIDAFKALFPMNARPLQPMNRRFLLRGV